MATAPFSTDEVVKSIPLRLVRSSEPPAAVRRSNRQVVLGHTPAHDRPTESPGPIGTNEIRPHPRSGPNNSYQLRIQPHSAPAHGRDLHVNACRMTTSPRDKFEGGATDDNFESMRG